MIHQLYAPQASRPLAFHECTFARQTLRPRHHIFAEADADTDRRLLLPEARATYILPPAARQVYIAADAPTVTCELFREGPPLRYSSAILY
jgi:hypothetical protein